MCLGKINNVDIVAETCSVRCRIVISENAEALTLSDCGLGDERNQVVRNASRKFSDKGRRMCSDRVEIAERYSLDWTVPCLAGLNLCAVYGGSLNNITKNVLTDLLGVAVWGCGALAWRLFRYRKFLRLSVNSC